MVENLLEEIEFMAKCLGVTPEEIKFMIKHFEMPIDDNFGKWASKNMGLFIQFVSRLFYEEAILEDEEVHCDSNLTKSE